MAATSDTPPPSPAPPPRRAPRPNWYGRHVPALFADQLGYMTRLARDYGDFVPLRLTPIRAPRAGARPDPATEA